MNQSELERASKALAQWEGAQLQGIHHPRDDTLVLTLRRPGETGILAAVCRGANTRIQLIERRPANPPVGSAFQGLCRKELTGRLLRVSMLPGDRILTLSFDGAQRRDVILELTGRHGNAFLVDGDGNILGSLLSNLSTRRRLIPGQPWEAPRLTSPPTDDRDRFDPALTGVPLLRAIAEQCDPLDAQRSEMSLRQHIQRQLRLRRKKLTRLVAALEGDLERAANAQDAGKLGDLLQINLRMLRRGMTEITVEDLFVDPPAPLTIPLAPELGPKENMARYYHRAKRYQGAADLILQRAEDAEARLAETLGFIKAVEVAEGEEALQELARRGRVKLETKRVAAQRRKAAVRSPYQTYVSSDGLEIRVGRGARDNDALTFRHAKGNDFWLHARGGPGAHVVIPCGKASPPLSTLKEAAALALKYSKRKMGDDGEVAYTRVKHVRRSKGAPPGRVTFSQDKSIHVVLEPALLDRVTKKSADPER